MLSWSLIACDRVVLVDGAPADRRWQSIASRNGARRNLRTLSEISQIALDSVYHVTYCVYVEMYEREEATMTIVTKRQSRQDAWGCGNVDCDSCFEDVENLGDTYYCSNCETNFVHICECGKFECFPICPNCGSEGDIPEDEM
jgi:hypothetical protein